MAYSYDPIFAQDPNNPNVVASNASITIFDPADASKAPVTITDPTGVPLANPVQVDARGMGSAFKHATLDRVGWYGAGFTGYFTSYEGMKTVATDAKTAAQSAANDAATAVADRVTAAAVTGGKLILTKGNGATVDAGSVIGPTGPKGDKGQDGANVLPTDTAVANAINDNASATKAALTATNLTAIQTPGNPIRSAAADIAAGLAGWEISEDFSTYPPGPLTVTSTGQPWRSWPTYANDPLRAPQIFAATDSYGNPANYLSFHPDALLSPAVIATYAGLQTFDDAAEIAMEVSYGPWSNGGGEAAMAIMAQDIGDSYDAGTGIPVSQAHIQTHPEGWAYDVNTVQNTSVDNIGGHLHLEGNLVSDGAARYFWHVILNKPAGEAVTILPSGKAVTVADPTIKLPGKHVFWEPFMNAGASNKTRVRIHRVWASSRRPDSALRAITAQNNSNLTVLKKVSGTNLLLDGTVQAVPGSNFKYITPKNANMTIEISGHVSMTADAAISIGVGYAGSTNWISYETVAEKMNESGSFTKTLNINVAAKPGYIRELQVLVSSGVANAATLKIGAPVYKLTVKAYPTPA